MRELRTRSCFAKLWKVTNCFHFFSASHLPYPDPPTISSHSFLSEHAFVSPFLVAKNGAFFGVFTFVKEKWKMVWRGSHQILCFPSFSGPCRLSGHIKRGLFFTFSYLMHCFHFQVNRQKKSLVDTISDAFYFTVN